AVHAAVNSKEVRPITDYVTTQSAGIVPYGVVADVYIPYGLDADVVMDTARKALDTYTESVHRVGGVVAHSGIDGSLHQPGSCALSFMSRRTTFSATWVRPPGAAGLSLIR
ncbi:baseplate assembly protein, partial [Enterobacter sp. JMULE2]|uniref:baseplate J/gp47 family protein n=1 Tax=Enterobacter sp. JMULE2 TaxID=2518340 RepID=UPI0015752BFA|nr:baseplate assembly protein [Enterobacter sp. JMULE2]